MLTCREAAVLVSANQDRELRWPERLQLRLHLVICAMCRRYAREIDFLSRVIRRDGKWISGAGLARLDAAARERIRRRLG